MLSATFSGNDKFCRKNQRNLKKKEADYQQESVHILQGKVLQNMKLCERMLSVYCCSVI